MLWVLVITQGRAFGNTAPPSVAVISQPGMSMPCCPPDLFFHVANVLLLKLSQHPLLAACILHGALL